MLLAFADPPYPGKAHLYRENTEVDHAELIKTLCGYDGWALCTDEVNLQYVLSLCPPKVRVLAWCKTDAMPHPPNPWASWEPVICSPARTAGATVRSFFVCPAPPRGFLANGPTLVGAKPEGFCEWIIRCLGAEPDDTIEDFYPGTGVMGKVWERWQRQPELLSSAPGRGRLGTGSESLYGAVNILRRSHPQLPGMPDPVVTRERKLSQ